MLRRFFNHKALIIAELLVLMLAVPLMMRYVLPPRIIVGVIWLMAIYGVVALKLANPGVAPFHWKFSALNWTNIRPMLWRFVLCAAPLTALVAVVMPEQLFSLPRERPQLWMFVMVFYPLLSVIPQQIIFRGYFFERYKNLFTTPVTMIAASALCFSFGHLLFQNWVAPLLTLIGGAIFAHTYHRHRSLALVWFEHALYGCFMFTVGLGKYFYHGTVGQ